MFPYTAPRWPSPRRPVNRESPRWGVGFRARRAARACELPKSRPTPWRAAAERGVDAAFGAGERPGSVLPFDFKVFGRYAPASPSSYRFPRFFMSLSCPPPPP